MHPADIIILISIGTCIGWTAAIYVNRDFRLMMAYIVGCPAGAAFAGYFALSYFPDYGKVGMIFAGIVCALLVQIISRRLILRFMKKI